jgi:hypothetical protein
MQKLVEIFAMRKKPDEKTAQMFTDSLLSASDRQGHQGNQRILHKRRPSGFQRARVPSVPKKRAKKKFKKDVIALRVHIGESYKDCIKKPDYQG